MNGVLPLWLGASVSRDASPAFVNISVVVTLSDGNNSNSLQSYLELTIATGAPLPDGADAPPRVHWLNSRLGALDDSLPRPYTPLVANASTLPISISMHGKVIEIGEDGLPSAITTFGASASPPLDATNTSILADRGASFSVTVNGTVNLAFVNWSTVSLDGNGSVVAWVAQSIDSMGLVSLNISGSVDATGYLTFDCYVLPTADTPPATLLEVVFSVQSAPANTMCV